MLPSNIKMESDNPKKFKMSLQNLLHGNSFHALDEYISLLESESLIHICSFFFAT